MRLRTAGIIFALALGVLAAPLAADAQPPAKVPQVGFLGGSSPSTLATYIEAFRQGLRELGYLEGRTIVIEYRYAEGRDDRLPDLAAELVRLKVDVIVTAGNAATQAAKNATRTIPIVMALVADPVVTGFIHSLARPGSNITGVTTLSLELIGKQMELLKEIVPELSRLAVLWNPASPAQVRALKGIETAARTLGVEVQFVEARGVSELDKAFAEMTRKRPGALTALSNPMFDSQQGQIAEFSAQNRLPAVYSKTAFAEAGGLLSYGARFPDLFRRAAGYVDKILKGTKPADLPVEQPTKFELVINLKTAKALGLTIPPSLLVRADKVIQ
jgi:putative ABC transport system substrate-binding protein